MSKFVQESLYSGFGFGFDIDEVIFSNKSEHQDILIFQNKFFGKVLMLDGITQLTTKDEFIYHEMMAHVPLFTLENPKNILIIGGGDGGIAREVLKHKSVELCTLVEIDRTIVDISLKYLPEIPDQAFDDYRMNLVIQDGLEFLKNTDKKFDVIIVDSTDPQGPGAVLFSKNFYNLCKNAMKDNSSIIVTQNGAPLFQPTELKNASIFLKEVFAFSTAYFASVPTYIAGMCMGFSSNTITTTNFNLDLIIDRFNKSGISTKYYNPQIHKAAFVLPNFIKTIMSHDSN
jgi:spermidine synthase